MNWERRTGNFLRISWHIASQDENHCHRDRTTLVQNQSNTMYQCLYVLSVYSPSSNHCVHILFYEVLSGAQSTEIKSWGQRVSYNLNNHLEDSGPVEPSIWTLFLQAAKVWPQCINQHLICLITFHHRNQTWKAYKVITGNLIPKGFCNYKIYSSTFFSIMYDLRSLSGYYE